MKEQDRGVTIGLAWYRPDQWSRLREAASDSDALEETHEAWRKLARRTTFEMTLKGARIERIEIDVDDLIAWCRKQNRPLDGAARAEFTSKLLRRKGLVKRAGRPHLEVKDRYGAAHQQLSDILFADDPVGINLVGNTDEYAPEVGTILPRLRGCGSVDDVRRVVHEEFVRWFDADIAGPSGRYRAVATRIWEEVIPTLAG